MTTDARLIYDSAREGARLGGRALAFADRVLLFHGAGLSIDVLLPAAGHALHYAQGQVTDERRGAPVRGLRVDLAGGSDVVETDEFGQFAIGLEGDTETGLLRLRGREDAIDCIIPAPGPTGGA